MLLGIEKFKNYEYGVNKFDELELINEKRLQKKYDKLFIYEPLLFLRTSPDLMGIKIVSSTANFPFTSTYSIPLEN